MRIKRSQVSILCLSLIGILSAVLTLQAQPAKGANKFLGNTTTMGQIRTDFLQYWNQITGENECKWLSIEGTRDVMNWNGADRIANFARQNNISWTFYSLITGGSCPSWIVNLSLEDQLVEIEEWFDAAASRYPDVPMIEVVNEGHPNHMPAYFRSALGGAGETGFDWIIKAFKLARLRWPHAILIYNDYNNIEYNKEISWTLDLINAMKKAGAPVDAIGCEAHYAYKTNTDTVKNNIDKLAATGLPIFITEYDIPLSNDSAQQKIMQEQFPMFWNHPRVAGITYWGYVLGSTWASGSGLLKTDGTVRPALAWLVDYVKNNPNPPNDFPDLLHTGAVGAKSREFSGYQASTKMQSAIRCKLVYGRNQGVNGVYVSDKRTEIFSLSGKKLKINTIDGL